jgi:tetracycline 7-halogenase / FADH2 O2-dependent halogenase
MDFDIAVLGGGFGGSLAALVLRRAGFDVALIDRGSHPRFAIGESSTPTANLVLRRLGQRYDIPELVALSRYGSWRSEHPDVMRGLKRGFSYFSHCVGEPFRTSPDHDRELLVAASSSDEVSDTQWLRSDVDAFLFRLAQRAGVTCFDHTAIDPAILGPANRLADPQAPWRLSGARHEDRIDITARFVIDATGERALLAGQWQTGSPLPCRTRSRAVFAHFEGLPRWETELQHAGISTADHPFRCDDAALHHLFDAGWMWQLRFDNDITSCGFALDLDRAGEPLHDPAAEWDRWLSRMPSVRRQFREARVVAPTNGLVSTARLQRRLERLAGPGWAALPGTAGFIDPLFSPGNAQIVCGVEHLASVLERGLRNGSSLTEGLARYERRVQQEIDVIDRTIAASYQSLPSFEAFGVATTLYFVRAIAYERGCGGAGEPAFLMADDEDLDHATSAVEQELARFNADRRSWSSEQRLVDFARRTLERWNPAGLLDPAARHMHARTAAE